MQIEEVYKNLIEQHIGSQFYKSDLHLHFEIPEQTPIGDYCNDLYDILIKHKIQLVGLTVHRQKDLKDLKSGIEILNNLNTKRDTDITFLPCIELKDSSNTHFSIIFNGQNISESNISNLLGAIGRKKDQPNENNKDHGDIIDKSLSGNKDDFRKDFSNY